MTACPAQAIVAHVVRDDVAEHQRPGAGLLGDAAGVLDGRVRGQQVVLERLRRLVQRRRKQLVHPGGVDHLVHQHVGVARQAHQVLARAGIAGEHHRTVLAVEAERERRKHRRVLDQRRGHPHVGVRPHRERFHGRRGGLIRTDEAGNRRQRDVPDVHQRAYIRPQVVPHPVVDVGRKGPKNAVGHLHRAGRRRVGKYDVRLRARPPGHLKRGRQFAPRAGAQHVQRLASANAGRPALQQQIVVIDHVVGMQVREEQRPQRFQQLERVGPGAGAHQRVRELARRAVAAIDHVGQIAHLQRGGNAVPAAAREPGRPTGRAQQDQARIETRRRIVHGRRGRRSCHRRAAQHQRQGRHAGPGTGLEQTAPRQRQLHRMTHFLAHRTSLPGRTCGPV